MTQEQFGEVGQAYRPMLSQFKTIPKLGGTKAFINGAHFLPKLERISGAGGCREE